MLFDDVFFLMNEYERVPYKIKSSNKTNNTVCWWHEHQSGKVNWPFPFCLGMEELEIKWGYLK